LFVFDYHDDLVISNSATAPTVYHFFQIKGHDKGSYTLNKLFSQKKLKENKSASIVGKLYGHLLDFEEEVGTLNFITNLPFSLSCREADEAEEKEGDRDEIQLVDLAEESLEDVIKRIKKEFGIDTIHHKFTEISFLKRSNLSVKDSSGHAKGKLAKFLYAKFPNIKHNTELLYQNIFDEVRRKSKYDNVVGSLPELVKHKGISRAYFEDMLAVFGANRNQEEKWRSISHALSTNNVPDGDILHYKIMSEKLEVQRMDPNNLILKEAFKKVREIILSETSSFRGMNLIQMKDAMQEKLSYFKPALSEDILTTIIFSEIYA